jgi:hypothetical protein
MKILQLRTGKSKSNSLLLFIVARVKADFGYSQYKQSEHIKFAQAPSGAHT